MRKILVLGANSAVAKEVSRLWCERGHQLYLVGRSESKLAALLADLKVRGGDTIRGEAMDLTDSGQHESLIDRASKALGGLDTVFLAFGELGDQKAAERDHLQAMAIMQSNALSPISLMSHVANRFEKQKNGQIIAISSVAGDRGRQSNYFYGTAKGAVSLFLSGLRNRLFASGVGVLDIRMGFVDTPMTAMIEKKGLLWAKPKAVAKMIVKASDQKKDIAYVPFFWAWIMLIIRNIPEFVFKRLKL